MKKRTLFYKFISILLLAVCCFNTPASYLPTRAYGASSTSYQGQIDKAKENKEKLEKEKKELEKKMAALKVEQNNLKKAIEQLDKEYMELFDSIETTEVEIQNAEAGLQDIEDELVRMEQTAKEQYESMKKRVQYLYENGEDSLLSLFISGSSIEKIFNEMEYRSQITKYDKELLTRYNATIASIEEAKVLQIARVEELQALKDYQSAELAGMDVLAAEKQAQMSVLVKELGIEQDDLLAFSDKISKTEDEIKELVILEQKRLEEEERRRKEAESRDIKNLLWPLEGCSRVTSKFGPRNAPTAGASTYHMGIDIGAPMGTEVHASLAGRVIVSSYEPSSGNYVVIDHGNGIRTSYCHASKLLVKVGDEVKRDQVIMLVGSTGVSTGPHLHYGLRINGVAVDPLKYMNYNR